MLVTTKDLESPVQDIQPWDVLYISGYGDTATHTLIVGVVKKNNDGNILLYGQAHQIGTTETWDVNGLVASSIRIFKVCSS